MGRRHEGEERQELIDQAREVKRTLAERRRSLGESVAGYKIALSSPTTRKAFNAGGLEFGYLFENMIYANGSELQSEDYRVPRLEPEIALLIGSQLCGGTRPSREELYRSVDGIAPAFEIVDSRSGAWDISLADLISDNAVSASAVVGPRSDISLADLSIDKVTTDVFRDNALLVSADSSELDDLLDSLGWLVDELARCDLCLEPGNVVLSGSWTAPIPVENRRQQYRATFSTIGTVTCSFS